MSRNSELVREALTALFINRDVSALAEHWDVLQPEEQQTASGRPMFEPS